MNTICFVHNLHINVLYADNEKKDNVIAMKPFS